MNNANQRINDDFIKSDYHFEQAMRMYASEYNLNFEKLYIRANLKIGDLIENMIGEKNG